MRRRLRTVLVLGLLAVPVTAASAGASQPSPDVPLAVDLHDPTSTTSIPAGPHDDVAQWFAPAQVTAVSAEEVAAIAEAARIAELEAQGYFEWYRPVPKARFTSAFGHRDAIPAAGVPAMDHNGIDLAAPLGTAILAAGSGEVVHVGVDDFGGHSGAIVVILHELDGERYLTSYNHMSLSTVVVEEGEDVIAGQKIAEVGNEGRSSGPHLHFSVREVTGKSWREDSQLLDPEDFMDERGIDLRVNASR